jgi:3-oxoacyl-[acyl-carrier-protein] synthase-3
MTHTTLPRVGISAVGVSLPEQTLTTIELQARVEAASGLALSPGIFEQMTGIGTRRVARDDEYSSTLAVEAARRALAVAGLDPLDVDLLVFASATRDIVEPATAHIVQAELGSRAHALDITNACNSFINGIDVARSLILAGRAQRALVVTGETPTRAMRWRVASAAQARSAFAGFTFGDAGAAVVVEPVQRGGILDIDTETHSEHWSVGGIFGGGSRHPRGDEHTYFEGDGHALRGVFEKIGPAILDRVRWRTGLDWRGYAKVLVHQVTLPYLRRFIEVTGVPEDRIEVTVAELGNVASATLGVQLGVSRTT